MWYRHLNDGGIMAPSSVVIVSQGVLYTHGVCSRCLFFWPSKIVLVWFGEIRILFCCLLSTLLLLRLLLLLLLHNCHTTATLLPHNCYTTTASTSARILPLLLILRLLLRLLLLLLLLRSGQFPPMSGQVPPRSGQVPPRSGQVPHTDTRTQTSKERHRCTP